MSQASKAEEPSMEEILASIRRIISDEDSQSADSGNEQADETPVEAKAEDDMGDASEMSQDDLDKLFDMDGDDDVAEDEGADDMAAAMMADAAEDESDAGDDDVLELTEELAVESTDDLDMVDGLAEDLDNVDGDVSFAPDPEPEPAEDLMTPPEPEAEPEALFEPEEPVIQSKPIPNDLPDVAPEDYLTSAATGQAVHAALDNFSDMLISTKAQTIEEMVRDMLRPMIKAWLDQNLPPMVEQMVKKEVQRVIRRRD